MRNEEKLTVLMDYLHQRRTAYRLGVTFQGVHIPLLIPKGRIAVFLGSNDSVYHSIYKYCHPVFIRDEDSAGFVIHKVSHTMQRFSEGFTKKSSSKKLRRAAFFHHHLSFNDSKNKK